jgi:hypothetical protein
VWLTLNRTGNNLVGNSRAILVQMLSIIGTTAVVISKGAVGKQIGEINHIGIRSDKSKIERVETPAKGSESVVTSSTVHPPRAMIS